MTVTDLWAGAFGDKYIARNRLDDLLPARLQIWSRFLASMPDVQSALELGCNVGTNLEAIRRLAPSIHLHGVEVNPRAAQEARAIAPVDTSSIQDFEPLDTWDLAFTYGVLIHVHPHDLADAYQTLYCASGKYILLAEYWSPRPEEVNYRGSLGRLWKRNWLADMLSRYSDLRLRDYGFLSKHDPRFDGEDVHWFVLEKSGG